MEPKILIVNSSTFTTGDIAISKCMVEQIRKEFPNSEIVFVSGNAQESRKYFKEYTNIKFIQRLFDTRNLVPTKSILSIKFIFNNFPILASYLFDFFELLFFAFFKKSISKRAFFKEMNSSKIIISAGGDALTAHYGYYLRLYEFMIYKSLNKKIAIYSSTIGPFYNLNKKIVISILKKIELILVRDDKSYRFLIENKIETQKCFRVADCAILLKSRKSLKIAKDIKKYNISKKSIGFILKTNAFSETTEKKYNESLQEIKNTMQHLDIKKIKVVIFAANNTDYVTSKEFVKRYNLNFPIINLMDYQPEESKYLLSKIKILVTSRMHPAIFASMKEIPVIGISDESKMSEFLRMVGTPELSLNQKNLKQKELLEKIETVLEKYSLFKNKLKTNKITATHLSEKNEKLMNEWIKKIN